MPENAGGAIGATSVGGVVSERCAKPNDRGTTGVGGANGVPNRTAEGGGFRTVCQTERPRDHRWWRRERGAKPNGRGGGGGANGVLNRTAEEEVVKASRGGRWYARDPRVEERTHTPLHDEAKEGLTFGVPAHSLGKIRWLEWLSKVWVLILWYIERASGTRACQVLGRQDTK